MLALPYYKQPLLKFTHEPLLDKLPGCHLIIFDKDKMEKMWQELVLTGNVSLE
jgi:hypothetical protein